MGRPHPVARLCGQPDVGPVVPVPRDHRGRGGRHLPEGREVETGLWAVPEGGEGRDPEEPSTIHLPHIKGSTPDREKPPTLSELAESDKSHEEGEV